MDSNEERAKASLPLIERDLGILDRSLSEGSAFLSGDALTLADLTWLPMVSDLEMDPESAELLEGCGHVRAWVDGLRSRSGWQVSISELAVAD
jgi:glutathione S-transferase